MVMMRKIEVGDITLEPQTREHAGELFNILCKSKVHDYTDSSPPRSVDELQSRLARLESRESPDKTERWLNWVIRSSDGKVLGYVQASVQSDLITDIAYVVDPDVWGQGIGVRATGAMIEELSYSFGVCSLRATIDVRNDRSRSLLLRLGFSPLGEPTGNDQVYVRRG